MTISKFVDMWVSGIASGEGHPYKRWQSCNVYVDGRTIYSYGSHFPMAYIIRPNLVWVNGDTFSVSTTRHQSELRAALSRKTDVTSVIVPNTALQAAGLDYATIEPVDVKPDRWEHTRHTAMQPPSGMSTELTERIEAYENHFYRCDSCERCERVSWAQYHEVPRVTPAHDAMVSMSYGSQYLMSDDKGDIVGYVLAEDGKQAVKRNPVTGEYSWHTSRHWLGDAIFTAVQDRTFNGTVGQRNYYISSFDRQERRPLYFLSQLPHAVETFEDGIESLAPESVKTARDMGRQVVRQGDMFAIPMDVTTRHLRKMGATFASNRTPDVYRHRAIYETHDSVAFTLRWLIAEAKESPCHCGGINGPTYPYHAPECLFGRLSRLQDELSAHLSYGNWPLGRGVVRREYGEWQDGKSPYRVAFDSSDTALELWQQPRPEPRAGNTWTRYEDELLSTGGRASLMGTAHTATEVATLPDGRQFARGIMYHSPALIGQSWRQADHRRQPLGNRKQWHLVARNTVPVSGTGNGRRAA